MILKASGALACALALVVAVPAMGADDDPAAKPKKHRVCRVLPPSAQPKPAPVASRRVQHGTAGASQTITVVMPRTTCNTGR